MNNNEQRPYPRSGRELPPLDCADPKDAQWIRVRNTANAVGVHALIQLLIEKGLFTGEELLRSLSHTAEYELDKRLLELNENIARSDFFMHAGGAEAVEFLGEKAGISNTDTVLEIGIGCGAEARQLYESFGCEVIGVERKLLRICESILITRAMGLDKRITFKLGDACNLPFENEGFDVVWIQGFPFGDSGDNSFRSVISEAKRVLKPSGRLALECDTEFVSQIQESGMKITVHETEKPTEWGVRYFGAEEYENGKKTESMLIAVKQEIA